MSYRGSIKSYFLYTILGVKPPRAYLYRVKIGGGDFEYGLILFIGTINIKLESIWTC